MNQAKSRKSSNSKLTKSTSYLWFRALVTSKHKHINDSSINIGKHKKKKKRDKMKRHDSNSTDASSSSSSNSNNNPSNNAQQKQPAAGSTVATSSPTQAQARQSPKKSSQRRKSSSSSRDQQQLQDYVPKYLKPYMYPYYGEYCYTPIFKAPFIAQVMVEGFLPVATKGMLLPKLHLQRCVIPLAPNEELHVSKSVRKKAKRFSLTVNQEFDKVIEGCQVQHGSHCWLYPPLVQAFREMMQAGKVETRPMDSQGNHVPDRTWTVRLYTIEVWNEETGALAGGELGYTVGSIYTSLTGFTKEDSAGSVQLVALGRLLVEQGFDLWDLGMDMEYKRGIGAKLMPRDTFVQHVHRVRETQDHLILPSGKPAQNCKDVIDRNQPQGGQQHQQHQQPLKKPPKQKKEKAPKPQRQANGALQEQKEENTGDATTVRPQNHTPPPPEAETPFKKKVRKSDSQVGSEDE